MLNGFWIYCRGYTFRISPAQIYSAWLAISLRGKIKMLNGFWIYCRGHTFRFAINLHPFFHLLHLLPWVHISDFTYQIYSACHQFKRKNKDAEWILDVGFCIFIFIFFNFDS